MNRDQIPNAVVQHPLFASATYNEALMIANGTSKSPYIAIVNSHFQALGRAVAHHILDCLPPKPDTTVDGWKRQLSNAVEQAMDKNEIGKFIEATKARLMREHPGANCVDGFFKKVADAAAVIACMFAHGLDPATAEQTDEEEGEITLERGKRMLDRESNS